MSTKLERETRVEPVSLFCCLPGCGEEIYRTDARYYHSTTQVSPIGMIRAVARFLVHAARKSPATPAEIRQALGERIVRQTEAHRAEHHPELTYGQYIYDNLRWISGETPIVDRAGPEIRPDGTVSGSYYREGFDPTVDYNRTRITLPEAPSAITSIPLSMGGREEQSSQEAPAPTSYTIDTFWDNHI